jgi:PAS domain S-box-containing protein
MNILFVEHHSVERSGLADQIRALDYQVTACDTASAALAFYQQMFYPLILFHPELPDLEFGKFCRQIRTLKQGEYSMIVILADQAHPENIQAAIAAGADDYLTQPVKQELLQAQLTIIERQLKLKQALDALKLSQTYAGSIIESSLDMIIAVDYERRIVEFNKAAQENFGYRLEEVLGKHINMLYADETESITTSRTTIEQGRYVREIFNKRKNGEIFPCLLSASILRDAQ